MAKMPSVMTGSHNFAQVPTAQIPRSSFDRSSGYKTTFNAGNLIPFFVDEVLPGDTVSINMAGFARLSTPLRPFMDNVFMNTFFFFVPYRLVWTNWKRFMGEQDNPTDSTSYVIPQIVSTAGTGYGEMSIYDYMGIPTKVPGLTHSALPLRAYNLIWNQWFRDQNLQNSVAINVGDGPDATTDYTILKRGKRHDYFTSSLPWPQKGTAVSIPLGSQAPVRGLAVQSSATGAAAIGPGHDNSGAVVNYTGWGTSQPGTLMFDVTGGPSGPNAIPAIFADLSQATAATINQLRQAFQIQKLHERDARGGTRYTEIVRAHFNVVSPDARLQRPEYLGGGQAPVNLYQVPQTAGTGASGSTTPQANLAAYGTSGYSGHGFTKSFTEHGVLIGLISVRADLNYQQGLNRMWSRSTKYDFYWPALAMIGEQAVLNQEIYAQGSANPAADAAAWGYQERFAEYRFKPSIVTGQMRSNSATPLDTWHLAQYFSSAPALNAAFIQDNPPIARVVAVPSEPNFILDAHISARWARPMPVYGVPGLIDHF